MNTDGSEQFLAAPSGADTQPSSLAFQHSGECAHLHHRGRHTGQPAGYFLRVQE